jgi:hypothetical protein
MKKARSVGGRQREMIRIPILETDYYLPFKDLFRLGYD